MNKSELIAKVAHDTKLTRGEAGEVVESTIENIINYARLRSLVQPTCQWVN